MRRVEVFGSFGFGNLGDEIIPGCLERAIRSTGNEVSVKAFSRYDNVVMPDIYGHTEYLDSDLGNPLFISGGGVIENHTMSCLNRALSKRGISKSKVLPFAVSVEPGVHFGWKSRLSLIYKLSRFERVYLRDELSSDILSKLSPNTKWDVIGDLGLWSSAQDSIISESSLPDNYLVFIPSDNWNENEFYKWIARELIDISNILNLPIIIMPISVLTGNDIEVSRKIISAAKYLDKGVRIFLFNHIAPISKMSGDDVAKVLKQSKLTISMRLHGCVISYAQRSPFVALAYHPKLLGFARTVGWRFSLLPEHLPLMQSNKKYGYEFKELSLSSGDLLRKSISVIDKQDYSKLEILKSLQSKLLSEIISCH